MTKLIGRSMNTTDTATVKDAIPLNNATATKLLDANPNRIFVHVNNNDENFGVWIREMPANVEPTKKKGIFIPKKGGRPYERTGDNMYTGELSAIAENDSPDVYVTEN